MTAAAAGKPGIGELQGVLASVALLKLNVQAVILEPATRTAFVARGKVPVAKGAWEKLDLSAWLRQ